jgi:hypothetical protein
VSVTVCDPSDRITVEVRRRLDLSQEAFGTDNRREFGLQDFERDLPLVLDVVG